MKKYISEFVGTFVLVFVACGVAVVTNADVVATSLAFGLVIVAMAYSIGNVSGCHINPAVSLAMLITKKMNVKDFIGYVVAQVIGALAGSLALGTLLKNFDALGANTYGVVGQLAEGAKVALLVEFVLTFIFVTVILSVTSKKENKNMAGLVIGLTLTLVHLIGIKFTGTSVNPARSLAPALLEGGLALKQVWVFIVGPLLGSAFASVFYHFILDDEN